MKLNVSLQESQGSMEQAANVFKTVPVNLKKQVIFELVALACADNDYVDEENNFLSKTELYEQIEKLVSE